MIDTNSLTALINQFRAASVKDEITPERLGYLLQRILDTAEELYKSDFSLTYNAAASKLVLKTPMKEIQVGLPGATAEQAGLMSAEDKAGLDELMTRDPFEVLPFDRIVESVGDTPVVVNQSPAVDEFEIVYVASRHCFLSYVPGAGFEPGAYYTGGLSEGYRNTSCVITLRGNIMVNPVCPTSLFVCDDVVYVPFDNGDDTVLLRCDADILRRIGIAGGIAELDDNGHVPMKQLPREVTQVRHVADMVDIYDVSVETDTSAFQASADDGCDVVVGMDFTCDRLFLRRQTGDTVKYYPNWADAWRFGEPDGNNGIVPRRDCLYVMPSFENAYDTFIMVLDIRYDRMRPTGTRLGKSVGAAYPGVSGKQLEDEMLTKQEQLVSSEDVTVGDNKLSVTEAAKRAVFNDMWDAVWIVGNNVYGKYDPENAPDPEHPYMGNDIWMTYEEAKRVLLIGFKYFDNGIGGSFAGVLHSDLYIRTALPLVAAAGGGTFSMNSVTDANFSIQVIRIVNRQPEVRKIGSLLNAFNNSSRLTKILGVLYVNGNTAFNGFTFRYCNILEHIEIHGLNSSISMQYSSKISYHSLQFMITNAAITAAITITVHPDVYAKITGDTTNAAAAELSDEELGQWMALLDAAAAKNIAFATV